MYRFLEQEEAVKRLPDHKKTNPHHVELEMSKHPVQCMACGVYFHLPIFTNDLALKLGKSMCLFCFV